MNVKLDIVIKPMVFDGVVLCDYCERKKSNYYIELLGMALCKDCRSQIIKDHEEQKDDVY
jgi:hypothetical protein